MTGYMTRVLAGAVAVGGLMTAGCHTDQAAKHGDPCWPDRYANESRRILLDNFQPQVENGHILDQTIWNMHFEYGTDRLNGQGMDKLDQLSRRRPAPDPRMFLQTARDIAYDPEKPGDYAARRVELDGQRVAAVKNYLKATMTGRETAVEIQIHDPSYPGIDVNPGVAPRVYVPTPQERARGANVPPIPVTNILGGVGGSVGTGAGPGGTPPPPPPPSGGGSGTSGQP